MIEIFFGYAVFASVITANKLILEWLHPALFIGIRMLTSGVLIFLFYLITSQKKWFARIQEDFKILLFISAIITFIPSALKAYGLKYLISSKASLIESFDPFITAIYAFFLWGELLNFKKIVGMLIAFSGIVLLLTTSSPQEILQGEWSVFSLPELAVLASIILNRYGWIRARSLLENNRYTPLELNALIMLGGGSYALFYSWLFLWCGSSGSTITLPLTSPFLLCFAYSIVVGNVLGYTLYAYFIKNYNMTLLTLGSLSIPLFVHLYGPIILNEQISFLFFCALGLVVLGTSIFYWGEGKKSLKKQTRIG